MLLRILSKVALFSSPRFGFHFTVCSLEPPPWCRLCLNCGSHWHFINLSGLQPTLLRRRMPPPLARCPVRIPALTLWLSTTSLTLLVSRLFFLFRSKQSRSLPLLVLALVWRYCALRVSPIPLSHPEARMSPPLARCPVRIPALTLWDLILTRL
jgi:hypothetical protein